MIHFFKKLLGLGPTEVKQEVVAVTIVETAPAEVVDTAVAPDATAPGNWPFPTGERPDDAVKTPAKPKAKPKAKAPAKAKPAAKPKTAAKPKAKPKAKAKK